VRNVDQAVETLLGGQRQAVAVARAAAFATKFVIMDEPTAALGVKEGRRVLGLIKDVKARGLSIILFSHNIPHVFEVADRIHIHRLGRRACLIRPDDYTMADAVAIMTGAIPLPSEETARGTIRLYRCGFIEVTALSTGWPRRSRTIRLGRGGSLEGPLRCLRLPA
jgi:fructose transport system ATP-binding protein